jgi:hypothetical protein
MDVGVTLDFGIAVHPNDGDQKPALLGAADERLYELKHAARVPPRIVPMETPSTPPREAAPAAQAPRVAPTSPGPAGPSVVREAPQRPERRKWERVSLGGTKAHAVFAEGQKTARVIDLSYGGVALLLEPDSQLPEQFNAVLHVPILPPVRVVLRKVSSQRAEGGRIRLGCSFIS